ncbi:MarR family transcriptional regulator [Companilactobacillus suantsaicola]|uniref:MarR family transcriptional regulator n=1 Tax=Companilactobacillus suantsaicola TaxID=2487723 RepID=A0A4Z0JIX1_9LACO|nr:MarR family winged helix-turn-helix transcriptional regulator [Companilactobacillus suantsaicola]TGD22986.1 MarR family transcriptional regulator [Companilactobacillus suantsaicola]
MASDVAHLIKVASNEISRGINTFAHQFGLTGTQVQIIFFLSNRDENTYQKDIEKEFNIRRPTATNILKTMEKDKLITRVAVKEDSRLKKIVLSTKSQTLEPKISQFMDDNNQKILSTLGTLERHSFVRALKKIPQKLKK